jgi:hypothetical protein
MKTTIRLSAALLLASAVSACDVQPTDTAPTPAATSAVAKAPPSDAKPTLIHSEEIGPDHKVDFYRLADGLTGYLETGSASGSQLLRDAKDMDSLAKVFQRIAPNRAIPSVLTEADRTAKEVEETRARMIAEGTMLAPPEGGPAATPALESADGVSTQQSDLKLLICSADAFGDSWGRNWWLDNFCYTNKSAYRHCEANIGSFIQNYKIKHFNYTAFEGDFNEKGHTKGYHWWCTWNLIYGNDCFWVQDFDFDVNPRKIGTLGYTSKDPGWVRVESTSPCGHLGVVAGWD